MTHNYIKNYLKAIDRPLPELKKSFDAELKLLKKNANKTSVVLDVGCGAGRSAKDFSKDVKEIIAIDNDDKMLEVAKKRCNGMSNINLSQQDALNLTLKDNTFDLVYATYNLVGSLKKEDRQRFINELKRVAKRGAKIINITWKDNKLTTEFLKKYYPSIDIKIIEADESKTVTSKGIFERISQQELLSYYKKAGLININFVDVGPIWVAAIGIK